MLIQSVLTFLRRSPWLALGIGLCLPCILHVPDRLDLLLWYAGKAAIAYAIAVLIDSGAAKPADPLVTTLSPSDAPELVQAREANRQKALLRRAVTIGALQLAFGLAA